MSLRVLEEVSFEIDNSGSKRTLVKVLCDCGKTAIKKLKYVKNGETKTCGSCVKHIVGKTPKGMIVYKTKPTETEVNLIGRVFSRWNVKSVGYTTTKKRLCLAVCECGTNSFVSISELENNKTNSCGCYSSDVTTDRNTTHGMTGTPTFIKWQTMLTRCLREKGEQYHDYGGRGITVSTEWQTSFENFFNDMGVCPDGYSLDRIDVNRGYCKENCRWADSSTQAYNTRKKVTNTSGRTGVHYEEKGNVWIASIGHKNESIYLGRYKSKEEAISVREAAEIKYYGVNKE